MISKFYTILAKIKLHFYGAKVGKNFVCEGPLKLDKIDSTKFNLVIGDDVYFFGYIDIKIRSEASIIISEGTKIDKGVRIIAANGATVHFGKNNKLMFYSMVNGGADITTGDYTGISAYSFMTSSMHEKKEGKPYMLQGWEHNEIIVGSDVQIGSHCHIVSGSKIGDGATIAPLSFVFGEVKPKTTVSGNPARLVNRK